MATKQTTYFGLSLQDSMVHTASSTGLTRYEPKEALTPRERILFDEFGMQNLVIDAQATKSGFGISKIGELNRHGIGVVDDTIAAIMEVREQTRSKEHQAILEEFTSRQISMFGQQALGALNVGGTHIALEIHRSLYVPYIPPERKGFFQRLFGG